MPHWAWKHTDLSHSHQLFSPLDTRLFSLHVCKRGKIAARYACPRRCPTQGASSRYQRRIAPSAADSEASDVQQGLSTSRPVTRLRASTQIDDKL
jgi:hypothetical protein